MGLRIFGTSSSGLSGNIFSCRLEHKLAGQSFVLEPTDPFGSSKSGHNAMTDPTVLIEVVAATFNATKQHAAAPLLQTGRQIDT